MTRAMTREEPQVLQQGLELLAKATSVNDLKDIHDAFEAKAVFHKRRDGSATAVADCYEIIWRAKRQMGAWIKKHPPSKGGRPKKPVTERGQDSKPVPERGQVYTLEDVGLSRNESSRYQALATLPTKDFEGQIKQVRNRVIATAMRAAKKPPKSDGTFTDTSEAPEYDGDEWYTPADVLDLARGVLGDIDLDPASNAHAQKTVQAATFYTKADDALRKEWRGRVFCNPPYSVPLIQDFTEKLLEEFDAGRCTEAIYLVNNCTDAAWCQSLLRRFPVCFTAGRIGFLQQDGQRFATRQGQAIFYLGPNVQRFATVFSDRGTVLHACSWPAEIREAS